jgi:hypothetical protein
MILILLTLNLFGCNNQKVLETHASPTGEYILQVELDVSDPHDQHLGLRLLDKRKSELDYMRTLAGDQMKWAVAWCDDNTITLDSHDVGTYGWRVSKTGRFQTVDMVSRTMEEKLDKAFKGKYGVACTTLILSNKL